MKGLKIILSTLMMLLLCVSMTMAQTKKKPTSAASKKRAAEAKKEQKAENFWTTKMWYGADINYPTLYSGFFNMSVNPRAAYKVTNWLSGGVVLKADYSWYRINESAAPSIRKYESFNYGGGVFARAKVFSGLFAHVEYEQSTFKVNPLLDLNTNKIITETVTQPYCWVGLGWASGLGKWKTQFAVYRNVIDDVGYVRNPWDIKFGIMYNF